MNFDAPTVSQFDIPVQKRVARDVTKRLESIRASKLVQARGTSAARFDTPELLTLYAKEGRKFRP